VPTTNEAAQQLMAAAMGNGQLAQPSPDNPLGQGLQQAYEQDQDVMVTPGVTMQQQYATVQPHPDAAEYPEGAEVFGGDVSVARLEGEPMELGEADPMVQAKAAAAVKEAKVKLGVKRNNADRSGVASIGISRVNAMGHPALPPPPDETMDEEEDEGEQI
jgi:hypothetical protein